jgi:hypothetical protein
MGLQGWWLYLKGAGLDPPPFDMTEIADAKLEVDIMSTFYSLIILKVLEAKRAGKSAFDAGVKLGHHLATMFPANQCTLHVDGAHSIEKAPEHAHRDRVLDGELNKLESLVERVEARSATGKRTSKSTWMDIERLIRRIFRLSEDDKSKLVEGLQTQFTMCKCISEADICIARLPTHDRRRIVVTADSDLLAFQSVTEVLRPLPHSRSFGLYRRDDVLRAFGFTSSSQLVALACVSSNDYGKNVRGFGLRSNVKIIKGQSSAQNVLDIIQDYTRELYKRGHSIQRNEFTTRINIYLHNMDSVIQESLLLGDPGDVIQDTAMTLAADTNEPTSTAHDHPINDITVAEINTSLVSMSASIRETLDPPLGLLLERLARSKDLQKSLVAQSRTNR